jgi:replicative DNA helicase
MQRQKERPPQTKPPDRANNVHEFPGYQPPANLEAEQSVLGAILVRPEVLIEVAVLISPEDFYREAHGRIYQAMLDLDGRGDPVDLVSVNALLKERGQIEGVGGPVFLAQLSEQVGFATNAAYYARVVRDKAALRRLLDTSQQIAAGCLAPVENVQEFLAGAGDLVMDAAQLSSPNEAKSVGELSQQEVPVMEDVHAGGVRPGLPVGYQDLGRYFSWEPEDLIILAGCPSAGKTALSLNFALRTAKAGAWVGYYSLEMSRERLIRRVWAAEGSINGERINQVRLTPSEWASLFRIQDSLDELPWWIDSPPTISISQLRVQARRQRAQGKLDFLIVDYLTKVRAATQGRSREEEVAEIARGLKALAKELKIPVLALATLNREVERRTNKRPMLSDLRESGAIEYEADIVMFLYRDEKYNEHSLDKGKTEVLIEKNRNGRIGTVKLAFLDYFQRFEDLWEGGGVEGQQG